VLHFMIEADVELRTLTLSDAAALEALRDGYTSHRDEWLYDGTAHDFIESALSGRAHSGSLTIGIFDVGSLAGVIICAVDAAQKSVSFDYMLGNQYRGRGLITQGIKRVLKHFFADRGFLDAVISTDPENAKSVAVAERLGFKADETIRGGINYGSDRGDLTKYKLTASAWSAAGLH